MDKEKYTMITLCNNCEKSVSLKIPKGTRVSEFKEKTICEYCGCMLAHSFNKTKAEC